MLKQQQKVAIWKQFTFLNNQYVELFLTFWLNCMAYRDNCNILYKHKFSTIPIDSKIIRDINKFFSHYLP